MFSTNLFKKFTAIILLASITLLGAGCSQGGTQGGGQITLKIWKPFVDTGRMQTLINAYQTARPQVRIEYVKKNIDNYETDLIDALASGDGPDIFSINNTWLPKYLDKVTPAPDKYFIYKDYRDTFVDVVTQDFTKDQKIYGTALWVDSLALYYNKDILGTAGYALPPKTWRDLSNQVQRIAQQNETGYFSRSGLAAGTTANVNRAVDILSLYMIQAGLIPWTNDGRTAQLNQTIKRGDQTATPAQDALAFYTSFADPASANYNWNQDSDYSIDAFANGRAAMMYGYSYSQADVLKKNPNLNFGVTTVPQFDLNGTQIGFANYFGEVVSKQSKNSAAAWDFLKFITSKESLDKYYAQDKQPSSRKDLIQLQLNDPDIGVFAQANLTAKSLYKPDQVKVDRIFLDAIDAVINRGASIREATGQMQAQAATIITR